MAGLSPKLPLQRDQVDGFYSLNKTHVELVKQNFKMLLLLTLVAAEIFIIHLKRRPSHTVSNAISKNTQNSLKAAAALSEGLLYANVSASKY